MITKQELMLRIIDLEMQALEFDERTDVDLNTQKGREMAFADNATASVDLSWNKDNIGEFFTPEEASKAYINKRKEFLHEA